ncbi:ribose-phosphate pyrophosphokinase-like domain-containing protein [Bradyrhizobium sp. SSUT77]|uniref:ribose-phosphate pyrophosphokinase-like domain-containing protein n=1 Tax=Bradyrhizobium sp. SSUT77 TaxID=3040603 RepID=UPI00244BBC55|nr:ribose-phosphate pyrophosphokinase-like domain-containing protein [Bradyrhizobium sp. SSUT77]MDH2341203.1 ribose-phosphate pyrophosphokinase-like domain-containing protein [Bradyrhizobium sp. SSUT77]
MDKPLIFAYDAGRPEAEGIAGCLGTSLAEHEERIFQDGERKVRPLVDPRGRDALVVQSLYDGPSRSVHDKLCDVLLFAGTLKDSGAARVILIAPYLCYARQDRRTKPGEPLSLRYVAQLIEAAGVDAIVTLDVHNPAAFENAFRIPTANIECTELFAAHFGKALAKREGDNEANAIVRADLGLKPPCKGALENEQSIPEWQDGARQREFARTKRRAGAEAEHLVGAKFAEVREALDAEDSRRLEPI